MPSQILSSSNPQEESKSAPLMDPQSLSFSQRQSLAVLAIGLFALLLMAAWLTPSPDGLGTHQQLGLPPCSMRVLFGLRCPGCGMTTSWALFLDGRISESVRANSGGVILCLMALWVGPMAAWMAYRGKCTKGWFSWSSVIGVLMGLGVALIEWLFRIFN